MIRTSVSFRELSKSVTADVTVDSDTLTSDEVLAESKRLYTEAQSFSIKESMKKARG